jgi:large subunit ribosomal protein L25
MSKQVPLDARRRPGSGKSEARSLRREGRVPAVAYGADLHATALSVDARELYHALRTDAGTNAVLRLSLDGDSHLALARQIQRHPVRREVLHVDFVTVSRTVKVSVEVPIHLEGADDAPGVDEGGVVSQELYALPVEVLPLEVPDQILADISGLNIGDVLHVRDLTVPAGVEVTADPDAPVVSVVVPQLEVPEPQEATGEEAEAPAAADDADDADSDRDSDEG